MGGQTSRLSQWLFGILRNKMILLIVGGAIGTLARYWVSRWINSQTWAEGFPYGTLIVNVSGTIILAAAAFILLERLPPEYQGWFLLIGTGFCGAYTTFSTFELETFQLVRDGSWKLALLNVSGSVAAGFLGIILVVALMRFISPRE